jgi:hypothetical protein
MPIKLRVNGNKNISHDKIKAKLGITNKKNHNVFYLEGSTFLTPNIEYSNYGEIMREIENTCRKIIKRKLLYSSVLSTNFLMNFDVCSDRMRKGKHTFLSFQYHFKQKNEANNSVLDIRNEYEYFFIDLLDDIERALCEYDIEISLSKQT